MQLCTNSAFITGHSYRVVLSTGDVTEYKYRRDESASIEVVVACKADIGIKRSQCRVPLLVSPNQRWYSDLPK